MRLPTGGQVLSLRQLEATFVRRLATSLNRRRGGSGFFTAPKMIRVNWGGDGGGGGQLEAILERGN